MHQTTLRVLALHSFETLLPHRPNETVEPIYGCFLSDFRSHLKGRTPSNRRALLGHMAFSLRRVVRDRRLTGLDRLLASIGPDKPLHTLDGLSDKYWDNKVNWELDHETAWMRVWSELKDDLEHCHQDDDEDQIGDEQSVDDWCFA